MRTERGFTLMELLVVLLIIGILSTVALRTIDATRDRSLFDQTAKELNQLVQAVTGNPDLFYDGRRTDFGFYGDLGRLPNDLHELVANTSGDTNWHGPYVRRTVGGDTAGYLYDAWGHLYGYEPNIGTISSTGNGKFPMTMRVIDSMPQLDRNSIAGNVIDSDNNPPGDKAAYITMRLYTRWDSTRSTMVDEGGRYQFNNLWAGTHRVVATFAFGDSLVRWVTVSPRSAPVVDFRFSKPFRNRLAVVGPPKISFGDSSTFYFDIVNEGGQDDTISSLTILSTSGGTPAPSESTYLEALQINSLPVVTFVPPKGRGDPCDFAAPYAVPPNRSEVVTFYCMTFWWDIGKTTKRNVYNQTFVIRFDDGSEITVTPR